MTVRLGVIGCGSVFWTPYMTLIERLAREGRVAVTAVYDADPAKREAAARRLDLTPDVASDVAVCEHDEVDAVLVLTSMPEHARLARAALEAGRHVLVEKPMATDLREIVGAIRISADLERIGDLGKNVAKRVVSVIDGRQPTSLFRGLEALADLALTQLKEVLDVYASRSVDRIGFVRDRDDQIDAMYTSLFRELLTYMMEDPRNISFCIHLMFCAKNIERIGDHATNIAETVFYMIEGQQILDKRPKGDMTTFATTVPGN